jgi:hypothetical protein
MRVKEDFIDLESAIRLTMVVIYTVTVLVGTVR